MNTTVITFEAAHVAIEPNAFDKFEVTLEADMKNVVENMDLYDRLYGLEGDEIVGSIGATKLLNAMSEAHFAKWVFENGDYYEALNAIGIEKIREWIDSYTGGE